MIKTGHYETAIIFVHFESPCSCRGQDINSGLGIISGVVLTAINSQSLCKRSPKKT
jgi:hypothetical protein